MVPSQKTGLSPASLTTIGDFLASTCFTRACGCIQADVSWARRPRRPVVVTPRADGVKCYKHVHRSQRKLPTSPP
eukprot:2264099-Pyramimonas_sp.AAC.1